MKCTGLVFAVIAWMLICSGSVWASVDIAGIEGKIKIAVDNLLKPEAAGVDGQKGVKALVEAIALASPDTKFPSEFKQKIAAANRLLAQGPLSEENGIGLLRSAYLLINAGKEFKMPADLSNLKQVTDAMRKLIEAARADLKLGKIDPCTKALLEAVMMITTPVIAGPGK